MRYHIHSVSTYESSGRRTYAVEHIGAHLLHKQLPYFSIRELSKRSDTLILLARTRRAPKLVFYIQSIQSLMLFVCDITGMPPMFTDAPNHIGFANFCLLSLFHFSVSSGRENVILDAYCIQGLT